MKNFTLLLAAILTALSASAFSTQKQVKTNPFKLAKTEMRKDANTNQPKIDLGRKLNTSNLKPITQMSRGADDIIYEAEGTAKNYMVDIEGWQMSLFGLSVEQSQQLREVVWGENGDVYFKNFIYIGVDYYIKGHYADGKITIQFPQVVYIYSDDEGNLYPLSLSVEYFDPEAELYYVNAEPEEQTITIDVAEDGTMAFNLCPDYTVEDFYESEAELLPPTIVGLVEYTEPGVSDWIGYGDYAHSYNIFDEVEVELPADANVEEWVIDCMDESGYSVKRFVDVAICGDEFYLGNLQEDIPDGWAKGKISGDKVYFEAGQYMGYCDLYSATIYFMPGIFSEVYLEEWDFWDMHVEFTEGITMVYDAKAKTLKAEDPDACIVLNTNKEELRYLCIFVDPAFNWQDPALCNAAPEDPEVMFYQPWDPDYYDGQGEIIWWIPATNINGAVLDTERMYYNFIVDGEIYGIDPEEYPFVEEYMEDIPYNYMDGMDIWAMGEEHDIYFYFDGAESFGLQSFYVGTDGVVYASNIVTYVPETTGISDVKVPVQVLESKYYDLSGREVANPAAGIYIKSMKLADGNVRNIKVMVK